MPLKAPARPWPARLAADQRAAQRVTPQGAVAAKAPAPGPRALAASRVAPPMVEKPTPVSASVQGVIEGIDAGGRIHGWAQVREAPRETLLIEVLVNGSLVAHGATGEARTVSGGAGMLTPSGFSLTLPADLADGRAHEFEVWAKSARAMPKMIGVVTTIVGASEASAPAPSRAAGQEAHPPETKTPKAETPEAENPEAENPETGLHETGLHETDPRQDEIELVRSDYLADMLATALTRVDELEGAERALHAENILLRHQAATITERLSREAGLHGAAPHRRAIGAFDGSAVRMMSVTRRRDNWLDELSAHGAHGPIFALGPHDGKPGPLAILIWGSGGIGDMLYLTSVVRELGRLFKDSAVFVLHENRLVDTVFASNPYVTGTLHLEGSTLQSFIRLSHSLDVFDIIAEVRYAVTYSAPPLSRAPMAFLLPASYRAAEWQSYVRYRWPNMNNLLANAVTARGMAKLDLVGWTAMLPIDHHTAIDLFIDFADHMTYPELRGTAYITIHHGSDPKMAAAGGQQTKNLPTKTWIKIVERVRNAGYAVVQLGETHEERVPGVDHDFRGRTSLEHTAYVLKTAAAHIDTEGGIVHLARTTNTPSAVAFGPTPVGFFGYPDNRNLAPPVCGNCWWTTETWSKACPRGLPGPECMMTHSADDLAAAALDLAAASTHRFELVSAGAVPTGISTAADEAALLNALVADRGQAAPGGHQTGAIAIGPARRSSLLQAIAPGPSTELHYIVPSDQYAGARQKLGDRAQVSAYAPGNVPINTATFNWIIALGYTTDLHSTISTITDLGRALRPGGSLSVIIDANDRDRTALDVVRTLIDTNSLRPGTRFILERGPAASETALGAIGIARSYLLTIRGLAQTAAAPAPLDAIIQAAE